MREYISSSLGVVIVRVRTGQGELEKVRGKYFFWKSQQQ